MTGFNLEKRWYPQWTAALISLLLLSPPCHGGEGPFFVTYTHQMEEPRNLEIAVTNVTGKPQDGNRFLGTAVELEYGASAWWTSELYLDGQSTGGGNTFFTGFRLENRFRVLPREHWINPVLYLEIENINGADKSLLEVVGHDAAVDLAGPVAESRREKEREAEARLILSSYVKGWTIAENLILEKDLRHGPLELGYAVGVSRPFALAARPDVCTFCRENFQAGVEFYGGLGTTGTFGLHGTSHYVAPALAWTLPGGTTFRLSPGFGITGASAGHLLRFGLSYEVAQFGRVVRGLFKGERP